MDLKKEMFTAIGLGLILGIGAAVFITSAPQKFLSSKKTTETKITETPAPTKTPETTASNLEILLPADQALSEENVTNISGKTQSNATVVASSIFAENVAIASDDGTFSIKLKLDEGANLIDILSYVGQNIEKKSLIVNYQK